MTTFRQDAAMPSAKSDAAVSPFDTRGPSLIGAELMRGRVSPNRAEALQALKPKTSHLHIEAPRNTTTKLIHPLRPARKGPI